MRMDVLNLVIGLCLLLFGRKLFWLFVGGAGFILGMALTQEMAPSQNPNAVLAIAIGAGVAGALLSLFLQKLAISVAGFVIGGYAAMHLTVAMQQASFVWLGFIIGGILGAIFVHFFFGWALVILSSVAGALVVSGALPLEPMAGAVVFGIALIIGLSAQAGGAARSKPAKETNE